MRAFVIRPFGQKTPWLRLGVQHLGADPQPWQRVPTRVPHE
jgi:hypothetical protein